MLAPGALALLVGGSVPRTPLGASHVASRINSRRQTSYTQGLGGRLSAASWRKILSGIARSPLRFACNIFPRRAAAFRSARRFLLAADTLGISASLRWQPCWGVRNRRTILPPLTAPLR